MENRGLVYSGFLLLPPAGKLLIKKSWQQKFCMLFKASKCGIERLEIYDNVDTIKSTPIKILTLENCIKITSTGPTNFSITTKSSPFIYEFGALNQQLKNEWVNAFQTVAFPDDCSVNTSIQEDNDLYCSSGEPVFIVGIYPSPASERCGLNNKTQYTLLLTSTALQLKTIDGILLYTWPYCFIRRYGYKSGKFTFEAGRKCDSGEGIFFLEHPNQQEIFRCLAYKMKSMKKLLKDESLDCGDNQLHAALTMEARSRSPLPPSPTTSTTLHDIEPNISVKTQMTHLDSDNSNKQKFIPVKPPRKTLQIKQQIDKNTNSFISTTSSSSTFTDNYEPIDKYDKIEYRSDAWRTMGVDDVKHTENIDDNNDDDVDYMSWGSRITNKNDIVTTIQTTAPKVLQQQSISDDNNYDKLDFFGSSGKLNIKSGYKQISITTNNNNNNINTLPQPPSFNDYDEVQPTLEGVRLADDSHLGYAQIRKDTTNIDKDNNNVNHQFHNNEPYAVISKPKRV